MNSLYASVMNEIEKIFTKKKTIVFLTINTLIPATGAIIVSILQSRMKFSAFSASYFPVSVLGIFTGFLMPLFIFAAAADVFAGEAGDRTMKIALTRPVTRFRVYLSKNLSIGIFIAVNLCLVFIASFISGLILLDKGPVVPGLLQGIKAYMSSLIPMFALCIGGCFISQFFKNSSGALTTSILVYIAVKGAVFISPKVSGLMPYSHTDFYALWLGNSVMTGKIFNVFMLLLSYSIIFFTAGFYFFDKKDI